MRKPPLSMSRVTVASERDSKSSSAMSSTRMSSSKSCGSDAISLFGARALVDELVQQQAGNHVERFKHAFAFGSDGGKGRHLHVAIVQSKLQVIDRRDIGQITLVVLQDIRNIREVHIQCSQ